MQMPPESVGICGILALDLPMGYLQGGDADLPGLPPGWRCRFAWVTSRVAILSNTSSGAIANFRKLRCHDDAETPPRLALVGSLRSAMPGGFVVWLFPGISQAVY